MAVPEIKVNWRDSLAFHPGSARVRKNKMRLTKWFTRILLTFLIASLLVGCSGLLSVGQPAEPVTLRFGFRKGYADYTKLATDYHQANPNVTIELVPIEGYRPDAVPGKDLDLLRWDATYLTPDHQKNILRVDDYLNSSDTISRDDFISGSLKALQVEGAQYGMPAGVDPYIMYAGLNHFKGANMTLPTGQWNMEEMVTLAQAANHQDLDPSDPNYSIGFCYVPDSLDTVLLTYLYGGQLFDRFPNPTAPTFNAPETIDAVKWIASLRQDYGIIPDPDQIQTMYSRAGVNEAVVQDKCGFWFGLLSSYQGKVWGFEWKGEARMLPLPYNQTPFNIANVDGYYIYSATKNPDAAWAWVAYLLDHQEAAGVMLPPRKSQIQSDSFAQQAGKDITTIARALPDNLVTMSFSIGDYQTLETVVMAYFSAVTDVEQGKTDAATALMAVQDQAETQFNGQQSP